jgi:inner membrane protein
MDSLTQIVLGAAVAEAVAGKEMGNKAILWGAVAGTIPDLDVFVGQLFHPIDAALVHRGLSHSLLFALVTGPLLGYLFFLMYRKKHPLQKWMWLFFLGIVTHPMLDMFTNYGTQFLWPFSTRITFNTVFVIDPLYTLPFLICLLVVMFHKKDNPRRKWWNLGGIIWSCAYLLWGVVIKLTVLSEAPTYFKSHEVKPNIKVVTPMPLTSFYWMVLAEDKTNYYVAYKSIFSSFRPDHTDTIEKSAVSLNNIKWKGHNYSNQLTFISDGNYVIEKSKKGYVFSDLRFGVTSAMTAGKLKKPIMGFELIQKKNKIASVTRHRPDALFDHVNLNRYWNRVFGNN